MKDGKNRQLPSSKRVIEAGVLGLALSVPVTELYLHAGKAHRTVKFSRAFNGVCWAVARATGIDPTAFAVDHRDHHAGRSEDAKSLPKAVVSSLKKGLIGRRGAEAILEKPGIESSMIFDGLDQEEDPVLMRNENGKLELKYQNKLDRLISKNALTRVAAFGGLVATHYGLSKLRGNAKISDSIAASAALSIAVYGPAFIGGALPESIDGYDHGSNAGRDMNMNSAAEILLGNHAYHAQHHTRPELFEPPGVVLGRDTKIFNMLEFIGSAERIDVGATE